MATKILNKVYPVDPDKILDYTKPTPRQDVLIIFILPLLAFGYGIGIPIDYYDRAFSKNYTNSLENLMIFIVGLLLIPISILLFIYLLRSRKDQIKKHLQSDRDIRLNQAKLEADTYSSQLNELLSKSEDIANNILPYFSTSARRSMDIAKMDFEENALSPFWDKIEEVSNFLGLFKQAVEQLTYNGEVYSKILDGRKHNFPIPFPFGRDVSDLETIFNDYNLTIRRAQSKFEFANIWEHRKTQNILIAGFHTLEQAINNMKDLVGAAVYELKYSIDSNFRELKNIQLEQIRKFETGNKALTNALGSMDNKLYYIQYHKQPTTPFVRPLND
jgi:hypothetical protein